MNLKYFLLLSVVAAKTILLTNDDGWGTTNIRAVYRELKASGHKVIMTAPLNQQSGTGGTVKVPKDKTIDEESDFNLVPAGGPAWGQDPEDSDIWYFDGTPAASILFGLDYLIPTKYDNITVDLVLSGPNEGNNIGNGYFVASGTVGAAVASVFRGVPGMALSGANLNHSFYQDSLDEDPLNPSIVYAKKTAQLLESMFEKQGENPSLLPLGVGMNVNFPKAGYESENEACVDPEWTWTRLTGQSTPGFSVNFNETSGEFALGYGQSYKPLTVCYNGDCSLTSESYVTTEFGCSSAISVFTIDWDAPLNVADEVKSLVGLF